MIEGSKRRLRAAEQRTIEVRLLGGVVGWVSTPSCGPRRSKRQRQRGQEGSGLYPELAVLGIREGSTPALLGRVGRLTALLPSFAAAADELAAGGCRLDIKVIHRIARQLGGELRTVRSRDLERYRAGLRPRGTALAGKRVGVAIDGGRVRLRTQVRKQKGKGKGKKPRRKLRVEGREPKVLIIFAMDARGRMVRGSRPWIDGTLAGPDEAMEILAMHRHRLGAAAAARVAVLADGAPWIGERAGPVRQRVGVPARRVHYVLDWCHAMHHVRLALEQLGLAPRERRRQYQLYRKWLRQGKVLQMIAALTVPAAGVAAVNVELRFLEKHAFAGHMNYAAYRRAGVPLGSGAIASAIRRAVNLRWKGTGLLWYEGNAEGMLLLRANVLTGHWDEVQEEVRRRMAEDRRLQLKPAACEDQATTQAQGGKRTKGAAAGSLFGNAPSMVADGST